MRYRRVALAITYLFTLCVFLVSVTQSSGTTPESKPAHIVHRTATAKAFSLVANKAPETTTTTTTTPKLIVSSTVPPQRVITTTTVIVKRTPRTIAPTTTAVSKPFPVSTGSPVAVEWLSSTSYCQGTRTASGIAVGFGQVASNQFPFGTRLLIETGTFAGETFTVTDRIGYGSELDFYQGSCSAAISYGRQYIEVKTT